MNSNRGSAKILPEPVLEAESISAYFNHLSDSLQDIPPENILHYDKINPIDDPGSKLMVLRRGVKYSELKMNQRLYLINVWYHS